jgi:hypothetical protein
VTRPNVNNLLIQTREKILSGSPTTFKQPFLRKVCLLVLTWRSSEGRITAAFLQEREENVTDQPTETIVSHNTGGLQLPKRARIAVGESVVPGDGHRRKHPVTTKTTNRKGKEKKEKKRRVNSTSLQGISSPTLT